MTAKSNFFLSKIDIFEALPLKYTVYLAIYNPILLYQIRTTFQIASIDCSDFVGSIL